MYRWLLEQAQKREREIITYEMINNATGESFFIVLPWNTLRPQDVIRNDGRKFNLKEDYIQYTLNKSRFINGREQANGKESLLLETLINHNISTTNLSYKRIIHTHTPPTPPTLVEKMLGFPGIEMFQLKPSYQMVEY